MRQIIWNLPFEILVVWSKVGPLALCTRSESFAKASHQSPFKTFARGFPFFYCLWCGSSSDVPAVSSSPDHGRVASQLDEWHCHLIPEEGVGTASVIGQVVAGVGSPIVVDSWGRWLRGWPKTCSPSVIGDEYISSPWASRGQAAVPPHRWLGKIGSLFPSPWWPSFLGPPYCPYELVAGCRCDLHRWSLPPR